MWGSGRANRMHPGFLAPGRGQGAPCLRGPTRSGAQGRQTDPFKTILVA